MKDGIMTMEEYEKKAEQYQTIIEDLYAALCEQKQANEKLSSEIKMLRDCLERSYEEDYD